MRRLLFYRISLALLALVIIAYAALYFLQDRIIFQTVKLDKDYDFKFDGISVRDDTSLLFYETFIQVRRPAVNRGKGDPDSLNLIWFFVPDSLQTDTTGLVIYFHGNRGNLQRWGNYAKDFTKLGYDVVMVDYRGYGKSSGQPSEENLYEDGYALYDHAINMHKQGNLVIYGRSLGTAIASEIADWGGADLLILETPFDELRGVIPPPWDFLAPLLPLKYRMSNAEHLKGVRSRVVIFHGTDDKIVPLSSALRLKPLLKSPDDFIIIPGGGHRNLRSFKEYQSRLAQELRSLKFELPE